MKTGAVASPKMCYIYTRLHGVMSFLKADTRVASINNKFYSSCQQMLHISAVLTILRHLNTRYLKLLHHEFYVHVTVHRNKFLYNKTNRCTKFPNLFWLENEPLHVSDSSSAHHQESINSTLGTGICHTVWRKLPSRPCLEAVLKPYDMYQYQV
jgi:hypothetical protein